MKHLEQYSVAFSKIFALLLAFCVIVGQGNASPFMLTDDGISLEGPNNLWVKTYNYSYEPDAMSISRTDVGYIIASTCSANNSDGLVVHVDAEGTVLFQTQLGNESADIINSVVQCQNGDFVTVGHTMNQDVVSIWLTRLAYNGSVLWERWYEETDSGHSVVECQDGSFIIAATSPHLLHVDANGSVIWSESYEDWDISDAWDVVECSDGGFAFAGLADTDPSGEIGYQAWLVRTDSNGTMLWNQTYGEAVLNNGRSLTQCSDGGFALAGESGAWMYYPRSPWLVRTDENGVLLWNRTYSTGYAESVVQCSDGGFGIAGTVAESASYSTWDALFVRTDDEGNELWRSTCSGPSQDGALSLVLSGDDGFAVAGWTLQDNSVSAFLWMLSDDYVQPTTTTSTITPVDGLDLFRSILTGSAMTGIFIAAVIIYNLRRGQS
jgi:hypothetical protein